MRRRTIIAALRGKRADAEVRGERRRCTRNVDYPVDKRAYTSEGAAKRAATQLATVHGDAPMRPYRCQCGKWHLTSRAPWQP